MDGVHDLYASIRRGGIRCVRSMKSEKWQESLTLDFKLAEHDSGPMVKGDRRTLAEALSGFANSDGGVIVWGVDCRRDPATGHDEVTDLRPMANLKRFVADLYLHTPHTTSPPVAGVEHHAIPEKRGAYSGFAVSFVPKIQSGLVMAIAQGQHTFYLRAGSSFLPMETFMVADRLGRRPQPRLRLTYHVRASQYRVDIIVGMRNEGAGIAVYPALTIHRCEQFQTDSLSDHPHFEFGLPWRKHASFGGNSVYAGGVNDVVHPNTELPVVKLLLNHTQLGLTPDGESEGNLSISYELYCDGFSDEGECVIPLAEIEAAMSAQ